MEKLMLFSLKATKLLLTEELIRSMLRTEFQHPLQLLQEAAKARL